MASRSAGLMALFLVIIPFLICSSCGYSFRVKGTPVSVSFKSIAIPLFESTSTDRGFEAEFTKVIRNEFISRSTVPIVESEKADAVITGRISGIDTQTVTYNTVKRSIGDDTVSYETGGSRKLIVRLSITMTERATGKVIWHEDSMEEEANFNASEDPLQNRYNREQAIRDVADLMAKRIYLNTMERF
ncbi:MAG: hypothetical protein JW944_09830 [Deltaproteobacteria bacterium]|nr:hypothetical protein [Deltaproteobacteria bacterium]